MAKKKPPPKPKVRRGARGKGTVFQRAGTWIARQPVGRGPTGRTLYLERRGRTQAEALRRLAEAGPPGPDTTVAAWAKRWLGELTLRPSTVASYTAGLTRHVGPSLGGRRVRDLTARDVEVAAGKWVCRGRLLSPNTVRLVMAQFRACLGAAVRAGLITANPLATAVKPKRRNKDIDPFTPVDLTEIVAACEGVGTGGLIALLATTGCRVGEAAALDATDWDAAAGTVSITKTYSREFGTGPPKSAAGVRVIRVPAAARTSARAAAGDRKSGPLFRTDKGQRVDRARVRHALASLLRRLGLPAKNVHQLRHSVATALISDGVPIGDAAAYLGDTAATVVATYLHPSGADPADALDRLFGGPLGGGKVAESAAKPAKPCKSRPAAK